LYARIIIYNVIYVLSKNVNLNNLRVNNRKRNRKRLAVRAIVERHGRGLSSVVNRHANNRGKNRAALLPAIITFNAIIERLALAVEQFASDNIAVAQVNNGFALLLDEVKLNAVAADNFEPPRSTRGINDLPSGSVPDVKNAVGRVKQVISSRSTITCVADAVNTTGVLNFNAVELSSRGTSRTGRARSTSRTTGTSRTRRATTAAFRT